MSHDPCHEHELHGDDTHQETVTAAATKVVNLAHGVSLLHSRWGALEASAGQTRSNLPAGTASWFITLGVYAWFERCMCFHCAPDQHCVGISCRPCCLPGGT